MKKRKILRAIVISLFVISCRSNSNKTSATALPSLSSISWEKCYAIIKSDCDYYIGGKPVGKLTRGQKVAVLDLYNPSGFVVSVEVETEDGAIKGQVHENYLDYLDDVLYDSWFKNILLTREYYYTGSVEDIYANSGYSMKFGQNNASRELGLKLWRVLYSEERICISERYLVIGNGETAYAYRIHSVDKKEKTYTLHLSEYPKTEFEITLIDSGDGIVFTSYIVRNKLRLDFINYSLNFKYIPCNIENSEKAKNSVLAWCDEQIEILTQQHK